MPAYLPDRERFKDYRVLQFSRIYGKSYCLSWMPAYLPDRERFKDHGGYDPVLVTKLVQNYRYWFL